MVQYRAALFDALTGGGTLQALVNCAHTLLGNPICVASRNGEILCWDEGELPDDELWQEHLRTGFIPRWIKQATQEQARGNSFIWHERPGRYRMMLTNPQTCTLRIALLEAHRPFQEMDQEIFDTCARCISFFIQNMPFVDLYSRNTNEYFLLELLSDHISTSANRQWINEKLEITADNALQFLIIAQMHENVNADWFQSVSCLVQQHFPRSTIITYEGQIVCLLVLDAVRPVARGSWKCLLSRLARERSLACVGRVFSDISLINMMYRQTRELLKIALETQNEQLHLVFAEMMSIDYMLYKSSKAHLANSIDSLVHTIFDHDQLHKTELLATLYAYLLSFNSISATAGLMGVHYNTIKQRLKAIEQLAGCPIISAKRLSYLISIKATMHMHPHATMAIRDLETYYYMNQ